MEGTGNSPEKIQKGYITLQTDERMSYGRSQPVLHYSRLKEQNNDLKLQEGRLNVRKHSLKVKATG